MTVLPIKIYRVAERSMEPSIRDGAYLILNCWHSTLRVGEVVVARSPDGTTVVKRIAKIGGRSLFLVGDNAQKSIDSRKFGWIGREKVVGKVMAVI